MAVSSQMKTMAGRGPLTLCLLLAALAGVNAQYEDEMNECVRGVRRAHPTQENLYQVFVRNGWRTQWLDRSCPRYHVYDHRLCGCVETLNHPSTAPVTQPTTTTPTTTTTTAATTTTTTPTTTTTVPPVVNEVVKIAYDDEGREEKPVKCTIHRPHHGDVTKYERLTGSGWVTEDCNWPFYTGLVWDQKSCRCEWGPNRTDPILNDSALDIQSLCLVMLNMTFDERVKDDTRGIWISQSDPDSIAVVREPGSVGGASALFRHAHMAIPFFKSNTLGNLFHVALRFKPCQDNADADLILLHNGCPALGLPPSLSLAYRAWAGLLVVEFDTEDSDGPLRQECDIGKKASVTWTDVRVHYEGGLLEVTVNGQTCISSAVHQGDVRPTDCQLTLPGEEFCGFLDEVVITRGCPAEN